MTLFNLFKRLPSAYLNPLLPATCPHMPRSVASEGRYARVLTVRKERGCISSLTAAGRIRTHYMVGCCRRRCLSIGLGQLKKPAARGWSPGASLSRLIASLRTRQLKMSSTSVFSLIGSIASRSISCRRTGGGTNAVVGLMHQNGGGQHPRGRTARAADSPGFIHLQGTPSREEGTQRAEIYFERDRKQSLRRGCYETRRDV